MHTKAERPTALLPQGLRPRAENRGRTLLPFHQAPYHGATHDLLVMNQRPDLAPDNDGMQPPGQREGRPPR